MEQNILGFSIIDWIGFLAMALLLVSFMMKNMTKLRIINSFGCAVFIFYGVLMSGWPIIICNSAIVLINLYYLVIKKK